MLAGCGDGSLCIWSPTGAILELAPQGGGVIQGIVYTDPDSDCQGFITVAVAEEAELKVLRVSSSIGSSLLPSLQR